MRTGILFCCLWFIGPIALASQCDGLAPELLTNAFKGRWEKPDQAIMTCDSVIKQLGNPPDKACKAELAKAYLIKGYVLRNKMEYAAANTQMETALQIREEIGDKVDVVKVLNALSSNEKERGDYKRAFQYSIRAMEKLNKLPQKDNYPTIGSTYITAANILIEIDLFSLSELERFTEQAKIAFQKADLEDRIIMAKYTLAIGYSKRGSLDKAEALFDECFKFYTTEKADNELAMVQNELGLLAQARGKPTDAEKRFKESIRLFENSENIAGMNLAMLGLASNYLQQGEPEMAIETARKINLTHEDKMQDQAKLKRTIINALVDLDSISQTPSYLLQLDSINQEIAAANLAFLEGDRQYLEELFEQSVKKTNKTKVIALSLVSIALIIFLILIRRAQIKTKKQELSTENQQQEKRFQQKIADILIDLRKEFSEERNNVNRVIHDVICPGIISIKREIEYAIVTQSDESQPQIIEETDRLYEVARALIKQTESTPTISWLQKIALIINQLNRLDKIHIIEHFNLGGAEVPDKIGNELAIIANVLLDNIEKWSQATQANLDLIRSNGSIMMIVDDNGKGFDPKNIEKQTNPDSTGIGLKNVRYRVERQLGGQIEIQSQPGTGTTITVSIPLK